MLIGATVASFDETGTDVNGKIIWVHISSTPGLTYQTISTKRGQIGWRLMAYLQSLKSLLSMTIDLHTRNTAVSLMRYAIHICCGY